MELSKNLRYCRIRILILFGIITQSCVFGQAAITITGGNLTLSIINGTPGGSLTNVVNTTATLRYKGSKNEVRKVTVSATCPGQKFSLAVLATAATVGVAGPQVNLSTSDVNFITGIPAKNANATATLQYTASATFAQGNSTELGDDIYTVTFTVLQGP